jgi:hypothetical protein
LHFPDVTHGNIREMRGRYGDGMELSEFDAADPAEATAVARVWAEVPGWVRAVVAGRPYASVDALAA